MMTPSSRGLGHRPFTAVTGVRIPMGSPIKIRSQGRFFCGKIQNRGNKMSAAAAIWKIWADQANIAKTWLSRRMRLVPPDREKTGNPNFFKGKFAG